MYYRFIISINRLVALYGSRKYTIRNEIKLTKYVDRGIVSCRCAPQDAQFCGVLHTQPKWSQYRSISHGFSPRTEYYIPSSHESLLIVDRFGQESFPAVTRKGCFGCDKHAEQSANEGFHILFYDRQTDDVKLLELLSGHVPVYTENIAKCVVVFSQKQDTHRLQISVTRKVTLVVSFFATYN